MDETHFFIVRNAKSNAINHRREWSTEKSAAFPTLAIAKEEAERWMRSYPGNSYIVFEIKALEMVRPLSPPLEWVPVPGPISVPSDPDDL